MPFGYSVRGHCRTERRKDRWFCNPKGIVSSSPATESARLPWVGVRAIFNPNGVVFRLRHRATTPLGLADTTRFSQGSSRLATLGFGAESLWDSSEISARLAQILAALDILVRITRRKALVRRGLGQADSGQKCPPPYLREFCGPSGRFPFVWFVCFVVAPTRVCEAQPVSPNFPHG